MTLTRTVLLGLDGATFAVLDALMDQGVMPGLRDLVARGVRAPLRSTINPLTPPAWTTVMTGRTPGNHGVFDFVRAEERDGGMYFTLTDSRDIACDTIWSIASRHGAKVVALNFPVMFPPQPVDGFVVPGFVPWKHLRRYTYPRELYGRIKALPGFEIRELAMDLDLARRTVQGLDRRDMAAWIKYHVRRERLWFRVLEHLMATEDWRLTGVNFDGNDKLLHLFWRFVRPEGELKRWEMEIRNRCLDYFRELDGFLMRAVEVAGPGARTFIVSDHGFGPSTEVFYVNTWLAQRGYLRWTDRAQRDQTEALTVDRLKQHVAMIDWDHTLAYVLTPSSNGVRIRVAAKRGDPGVPPQDYAAFRDRLAKELHEFRDPVDGRNVLVRVRSREEAYPGMNTQLAPDLLLTLRDGGFVSILNADAPLKRRAEVVGTHRPEGIFIASGAGVRAGASISALSIADVAPTLLTSMGIPVPKDFEGRFVSEAFTESLAPHLEVSPTGPAAGSRPHNAGLEPSGEAFTPDEEAEVLNRLSALGYI